MQYLEILLNAFFSLSPAYFMFVCVLQVCSVLESLEQEYRRDEDWCGGHHDKLGTLAEMDHVLPLISKHLEQKEAFLKVRTELIDWTILLSLISPGDTL